MTELAPEEGWKALPSFEDVGFRPAFVSGEPQGQRLRVRYFIRERDGHLVGKAWFGPAAEGPPGHAHGGSIAAVLDEAMGVAAWYQGHAVVAVQLTINFRAMVPLDTVAYFEAWLEEVQGRKVTTRGKLFSPVGTPYSDGRGLFLVLGYKAEQSEAID